MPEQSDLKFTAGSRFLKAFEKERLEFFPCSFTARIHVGLYQFEPYNQFDKISLTSIVMYTFFIIQDVCDLNITKQVSILIPTEGF